ncbi:uncharacterized protein LOC129613832 [Condylostylus longicornis]|uniref:uncharacterized protein LOC129613832 n=1 Tax=Condylostylus longicornis TaxID=2530218 RepID=UPI00244DE43F|nr:uncharacterized protein LOC129613832 [Condylostylus longicornis]
MAAADINHYVLCSLSLASCASLDGYQYKQNQQGFIGNSILGVGGGGGHHHHSQQQGFIGLPSPNIGNQINSNQHGLIAPPLPPVLPAPLPPPSYSAPHQSSHIQGQAVHGGSAYQGIQQNIAPIVTKDVYVHVAPEEPEEHIAQPNLPQQPPRKHYRIIFIKAPSQSSRSAALKLAQAQAQVEEKTVIYVLTKKTDAADIQAALQQIPQPVQHKPEVFFIKYKTQQEALHAQQQIQAQYDALGGTSQITDEGIAPVSSVIGALGNGGHSHGHINGNGGGGLISGTAPSGPGGLISHQNSGYLPPHRH